MYCGSPFHLDTTGSSGFLPTLGVPALFLSVKQLQDKWNAKQNEEGLDEVVACGHGCALNMHAALLYTPFSIKFTGEHLLEKGWADGCQTDTSQYFSILTT